MCAIALIDSLVPGMWRPWRKKEKPPVIPYNQMTREYKILNATASNFAKAFWSNPIRARNALEATMKFYKSSRDWEEMDHEILYCVDTEEVLYVKTEYLEDMTVKFSYLWEKPPCIPKRRIPLPVAVPPSKLEEELSK